MLRDRLRAQPYAAENLRVVLGFRNATGDDLERWSQTLIDGTGNYADDPDVWAAAEPKVIYHHDDGATDVVAADAGSNVMRAAVQNGVAGIVGECGGQAMCATCHVYVREDYLDVLPEIGEDEEEMLDCTAAPRDERRSRLGCQLALGDGLEEVEVDVPASQI